jgi:hypothetical protein
MVMLVDGRENRGAIGGVEDLDGRPGRRPGRAGSRALCRIPVQMKAGTYDVAVTFVERARVVGRELWAQLPGDEFSLAIANRVWW